VLKCQDDRKNRVVSDVHERRFRKPSCGLAVVLPGGHRIEAHPDFDTNAFERLVSLLERA